MWRECIDALMGCQRASNRRDDHRENGPLIFVDATLGGGGHSAAILEQLQPGDVLFGCDVDSNALETATARLKKYVEPDPALPLFVPVQSNFCDLLQELPKSLHPTTEQTLLSSPTACIDGILLDLGVSSHQIDTAERGFAFMKDGPLDMRMGISASSSMTAADICNEFEERQLRQILKVYGDEPRAKRIAQSIVQHRPLSTTQDLRNAIADVTPDFSKKGRRMGRTATLARVFQSLRIVVNQEDAVLQRVLEDVCPTLVRPGGRLVVLSYHSMEDRFTKRVMRDGVVQAVSTNQDDRDIYGNYIGRPKPWKSVGKRRKASEEEVELNSRARSATLRVAERSDT
jgi:16S rRNA (cytosine1402-N4)-methyltransferase